MREKTLYEIKAKLDKHYSESAPLYGMVQKWFTKLRCGRTSTESIPSPGRPNEITAPEMINKIHDIVLNDPKVKVRDVAINWFDPKNMGKAFPSGPRFCEDSYFSLIFSLNRVSSVQSTSC